MKTLMRTNNDAMFQGDGVTVETHITKNYYGYDVHVTIETETHSEFGNICRREKIEYGVGSYKKEAQKAVTAIARKYCN